MTTRVPDVLGGAWTAETLGLPPDDEGSVVATLVHHPASGDARGAVLHVHGFADYFFQVDFGRWWTERGYDFYALDLRKYGRSIRPHQTPTYVTDLAQYYPELDLAWQRITRRDGHERVLLSAHSTGGLTTPLWVHDRRPPELVGIFLNAPWLDLAGPAWVRSLPAATALNRIGTRQPMREYPRTVAGYYTRSLHRDHEGEFDFDLGWKPIESFPVRFGWLRAIRRGHARVHGGLAIDVPTLVITSDRSAHPTEMGEDVHACDIVLDVAQIRRWAPSVSSHLTYVAVPGARHDVVLSRAEPRERVYAEIDRWASAYLPS